MTQEQKARAYDEALNRADSLTEKYGGREFAEYVFPELAESEDERTRKELLEEIESIIPHEDETDSEGLILPSYHTRIDRYKSYLEKQKEYELTEEDKKIIPEALVMLCDDIINHRVHTPIKTDEEGARKIKAFLKTFNRQPHKTMKEWEKQKEQKSAEKQDYSGLNDLERAIHRGFLCAGVENVPVTIIKETAKECLTQMKPAWNEEDKATLNSIIWSVHMKSITPLDEMDDRNKYEKYEDFLKSLPKRFVLQPKQEWSEEDERILNELLDHCNTENATWYNWLKSLRPPFKDRDMKLKILKYLSTRCSSLEFEEVEDYLNNLHPPWKPSEEQIMALRYVLNHIPYDSHKEEISGLLKQILKL